MSLLHSEVADAWKGSSTAQLPVSDRHIGPYHYSEAERRKDIGTLLSTLNANCEVSGGAGCTISLKRSAIPRHAGLSCILIECNIVVREWVQLCGTWHLASARRLAQLSSMTCVALARLPCDAGPRRGAATVPGALRVHCRSAAPQCSTPADRAAGRCPAAPRVPHAQSSPAHCASAAL